MNYETVYLEEKQCNGLFVRTTNENMKAIEDISTIWQEFISIYPKLENKLNSKVIGLYTNYEKDYSKPYDFYACYECTSKHITIIPSGKYAKFIVKGHPKIAIEDFWLKLWKLPLNRAYLTDYEEYQNNNQDINNQEIHIYISIK